MRVLIDTNVVLDFILKRPGFFADADELFVRLQNLDFEGYVSPITPINAFYTTKKEIDKATALVSVEELLKIVQVCPTDKATMLAAFSLGFSDYEDAVQCASAMSEGLDAIITRNTKDYKRLTDQGLFALRISQNTQGQKKMKPPRIYLVAIISLMLSLFCSAQTIDEESNWYKEIGKQDDYYSRFDFSRYTKSDVEKAKAKFLRISSMPTSDEWAGTYRRQTMLGSAEITWDKNGFVYTYVYHTLASVDYGSTRSTGDSLTFVSEKPTDRRGHRFIDEAYIQVKFGERHLLVPKNRLNEFATWVVGREIATGQRQKEIYTEEGFFWEKVEEEKKEIALVPIFPDRYVHLIRKPIVSKVLSVGKLRIKREKSVDWGTTSQERLVMLRLSSGKRQGIRVGMRFWVDDLEEWIEIRKISANYSFAELSRPFIDGKEYCNKYENFGLTEFPCRNPKVGVSARTRVDYF